MLNTQELVLLGRRVHYYPPTHPELRYGQYPRAGMIVWVYEGESSGVMDILIFNREGAPHTQFAIPFSETPTPREYTGCWCWPPGERNPFAGEELLSC